MSCRGSRAGWPDDDIDSGSAGNDGRGARRGSPDEDGLRILHRNWRCRYGELDVIASDKSAELHRMQHCDEVENDLSCWWARVRGFRVTIGELP
jgi:hypothetical protein